MLRITLFAMAVTLFFMCPSYSWADEPAQPVLYVTNVPKVHSVEFYPSGAKFTFSVQCGGQEPQEPATPEEPAVKKPAVFEAELPGAFDAASVRPVNPAEIDNFSAVKRARPANKYAEGTEDAQIPPHIAKLRKEIADAEHELAVLNARISALSQTLRLLDEVQPSRDSGTPLLSGMDIISYIRDAQSLRHSVETESVEMAEKKREAEKTLASLRRRLAEMTPSGTDDFIIVSGRPVGKTTNGTVLIEAFTRSARWYPHYVMDMGSTSGDISAILFVTASQNTGTDYTGDIVFHTKNPDEDAAMPEMNPMRVRLRQRSSAYAAGSAKMSVMRNDSMPMPMAEMMVEDSAMYNRVIEEPVPMAAPSMEATLSDMSVTCRGTLDGDGREIRLLAGEIKLESKPVLTLMPEFRDTAWIVADMAAVGRGKNSGNEKSGKPAGTAGSSALIPGNAELRVDGSPSGSAFIPEFGIDRLPFGHAPRVTAKRKPIVEMSGSEKSWFSSSGKFAGGYTIDVTNGMDADRTITVLDRMPVPTDERIKLEGIRITPEPKERNSSNIMRWELNVGAGKTERITVEYTLVYPSGETLEYR